MNADKTTFTRRLREALTHFYEPAFLQTSPLAELVTVHSRQEVPAALRDVLRRAIEALRPPASVPYGRPEWISYRVLWAHYIERQPRYQVCDDLGLSRTTYYRYQQQALEAMSALLWERQAATPLSPAKSAPDETLSLDERAILEAVRLAETARRVPVLPAALVQEAMSVLAPLADQRGVALELDAAPDLPPVQGDPAILHQIVIGVAMTTMECVPCATLRLQATFSPSTLTLRATGVGPVADSVALLEQLTVSQRLLAVYGGGIRIDEGPEGTTVVVELPSAPQATILVADDDRETVDLYQRYLQSQGYLVRVAVNGAEITRSIAERRPDLILLDVLMPQEDGWVALQRLKTLPESADIPVIVYSVLGQPSLALALGAIEVLRKPIQETELLRAVRAALDPNSRG